MKNFNFDFYDQIWQIFDDQQSESIVIATKNKDQSQSSFYLIDLTTFHKKLLPIILPGAVQWNVAKVYQQRIIFQAQVSNNQPTHQYVLVYDIATQKILFENYQRSIQNIVQQGIITFLLKVEPKKFELLAFDKNEVSADLTIDPISSEHLKLPSIDDKGCWYLKHQAYHIKANNIKGFSIQVLKNDQIIHEWTDLNSRNISPENDYFMMIHDYLIILKEKKSIEIINLKA